MYKFDSMKPVLMAVRGTINNSTKSIASAIDTAGFGGGMVLVTLLIDTVSSAPPVLGTCELVESDNPVTDPFTTIPGCDAVNDLQSDGSANEFPLIQSDDNSMVVFYIPLTVARKRYFSMAITETAGANVGVAVTAFILGKSHQTESPASFTILGGPASAMYRATS